MIVDINTSNKKYGIVYSDPPWQQKKGGIRKCRPRQGKTLDYDTMNLEGIKELHSNFLMNHTEEKHNVFCWTIDKYLHETESMFDSIGYKLHARMIWDKTNGVAPAFTVRFAHEYLLWFYRNKQILMPCAEERGKFTTVFREASTVHSKKPEIAYKIIETMFPEAKKIELFARIEREGWDSFGNEINVKEVS